MFLWIPMIAYLSMCAISAREGWRSLEGKVDCTVKFTDNIHHIAVLNRKYKYVTLCVLAYHTMCTCAYANSGYKAVFFFCQHLGMRHWLMVEPLFSLWNVLSILYCTTFKDSLFSARSLYISQRFCKVYNYIFLSSSAKLLEWGKCWVRVGGRN